MSAAPATGEPTASIYARHDDDREAKVLAALREEGAVLWWPGKVRSYYVRRGAEVDGFLGLSKSRVRKLEREGVIELVGPFTYQLKEPAQ